MTVKYTFLKEKKEKADEWGRKGGVCDRFFWFYCFMDC